MLMSNCYVDKTWLESPPAQVWEIIIDAIQRKGRNLNLFEA